MWPAMLLRVALNSWTPSIFPPQPPSWDHKHVAAWLTPTLNFACPCLLHFRVLRWLYSKGNRPEEATPRSQRGGAFLV